MTSCYIAVAGKTHLILTRSVSRPWQVLHQSGSYEDRLSSGLYSNAVMSDWTAASSLHSLQHTYSQSADSDFSGATVSSGLNDSPMFKRNFSFNEMYSAVRESTDNKWVTGRAPHNVAGRRLEPLQRRTDRWAARWVNDSTVQFGLCYERLDCILVVLLVTSVVIF